MFAIICGEPESGSWFAARNIPSFREAVRIARDLRRNDAGMIGPWKRDKTRPGHPWFWLSLYGYMEIIPQAGEWQ